MIEYRPTSFSGLPNDVAQLIVKEIDTKDRLNCRRVSKEWRNLFLRTFLIYSQEERGRELKGFLHQRGSSFGIKYLSPHSPLVYLTFFVCTDQKRFRGNAEENFKKAEKKLIIVGKNEAELIPKNNITCPKEKVEAKGGRYRVDLDHSKHVVKTQYQSCSVDIVFSVRLFEEIYGINIISS